jgi:hypothetical protein
MIDLDSDRLGRGSVPMSSRRGRPALRRRLRPVLRQLTRHVPEVSQTESKACRSLVVRSPHGFLITGSTKIKLNERRAARFLGW